MKEKEYILCSAIDYGGIIIAGRRHGDCADVLKALVKDIDESLIPDRDHQGFLTSENRFVGREEAWVIAKANDQIKYGLKASDRDNEVIIKGLGIIEQPKSMLISENLFMDFD